MKQANLELRQELSKRRMYQYELAELLGITEEGLSRKLRKELSKEDKEKIMGVIKNAK